MRALNTPNEPHIVSISSIGSPSIDCLPAEASSQLYSGMFVALPAQDMYKCSRCPVLEAATNYTIFLVATEGSSEYAVSTAVETQALNVQTLSTPTVPRLLSEPSVLFVNSTSIALSFEEELIDSNTTASTGVAYALTYARISAPFFPGYSLDFPVAEPTPEDIIAYARTGGPGALVPTGPSSSPNLGDAGGSYGYYGSYGGAYGDYSGSYGTYGAAVRVGMALEESYNVLAAREQAQSVQDTVTQESRMEGLGGVIAAGFIETSGNLACLIHLEGTTAHNRLGSLIIKVWESRTEQIPGMLCFCRLWK